MSALLTIIRLLVRSEGRAIALGLTLSILVLAMGTALLGLSGWFITATAVAGLAGLGALFNVFLPSAMVRFLALGRTAARYGERLSTHDTVLRALAGLRLRLLRGLLDSPWRKTERLRAASALNRITADVDALDGALLRLVLPGLAGGVAILIAAIALWLLVHPVIGALIGGGYLLVATLIFAIGQRRARVPSRRAEAALQALRGRLITLVSARDDLTVYGQIPAARAACERAAERSRAARTQLNRLERRAGLGLDLVTAAVTAGALGLGVALVNAGLTDGPRAAIGVFVALALAEAIAPVRRALTEIGGMTQAARRIAPALAKDSPQTSPSAPDPGAAPALTLQDVAGPVGTRFAPVSLCVAPGETVALAGPSGIGKSTVLLMAAGALPASAGRLTLGDIEIAALPSAQLHRRLLMVPQRSALLAGSIAENLRLAAPEATDAALWAALEATCLAPVIHAKGGLEARLGPRGAGLSGGEARRLVLARALLAAPQVLLLDEPTEGIDAETAAQVMDGIRTALPETALLIAAHRSVELASADRILELRPTVT